MTLSLFALGVYTAATGSGLACQAQWPLCSDQLIPTLAINPDFIEWFHRAWAMVTGFLILGVGAWSWLGSFDRRTRLAATLAVAILPIQITVGAITVTLGGLVPGGYTVSTHAAHLTVALCIFTLLGLATMWGGRRGGSARLLRAAFGVALAGILVSTLFSRAVPLLTYAPGAQAAFYLAGLSAHLGFVAALVSTTESMNGTAAGIQASTAQAVRAHRRCDRRVRRDAVARTRLGVVHRDVAVGEPSRARRRLRARCDRGVARLGGRYGPTPPDGHTKRLSRSAVAPCSPHDRTRSHHEYAVLTPRPAAA